MKKEKVARQAKKEEVKSSIAHFYKFKNARMIRISGNFMGGGFSISQNKAKAILENLEEVKKFAEGGYDKEIDELTEEEILKY